MKADGTVNRAALPAIFNPEDLNALEQALVLKDMFPGSTVEILTMGPGRAAEIIREGMYRGADGGVLLSDRKFAGSDTLATSYALSRAILNMKPDIIVAGGRPSTAIPAQVGPQVAEKLGWPQITYAEEIVGTEGDELVIKRRLEHGVETVACPLPLVMTVNGSAPECRPRHAKLVMKCKYAKTASEMQEAQEDYTDLRSERPYLNINEWRRSRHRCPTTSNWDSPARRRRSRRSTTWYLPPRRRRRLTADDRDIDSLMQELIASHTLG